MTKPITHGILCHKYRVKAMKRRVHSGALNREPRYAEKGRGIINRLNVFGLQKLWKMVLELRTEE